MHRVVAEGLQVEFPYEPYQSQQDLALAVVQSLTRRQNALLESPTGTGKTLSLLCGSLAWASALSPEEHTGPKIIYASRTHTQLSQAVRELRKTSYRPKIAVLASRTHLCVHPEVSKLSGSRQNTECRKLVRGGNCAYMANLDHQEHVSLKSVDHSLMDIEDLRSEVGSKRRCCPYYYSSRRVASSDLVFMPYNYIVDAQYRNSMKDSVDQSLDLSNTGIVFDEAHNLESVAMQSASFELSSMTLFMASQEVQRCIDICHRSSNPGAFQDFASLKVILLNFERKLRSFKEGSHPPDFVYQFYQEFGVNESNFEVFCSMLDKAHEMIQEDALANSGFQDDGKGSLELLKSAIQMPFSCKDVLQFYKVHISKSKEKNGPTTLNFWCLSPSVSIKELSQKVRCMIFSSGTLAPFELFSNEYGIQFSITVQAQHVIKQDQIFCAVVTRGPNDVVMNSSFENRGKESYIYSVGNLIINYCKHVPNGILVFVPSNAALEIFWNGWNTAQNGTPSILERLSHCKKVFREPSKHSDVDYNTVISEYRQSVSNGAILFAVCRGKVSEGVDFKDEEGRAVIMLGIPYPSRENPQICLKKEFLDKQRADRKSTLSGSAWYQKQATRAVNQAIGRVIRHVKDYGAMILCDQRFSEDRILNDVSKWIRPYVKIFQSFGPSTRELSVFFKSASANPDLLVSNSRKRKSEHLQSLSISESETKKISTASSRLYVKLKQVLQKEEIADFKETILNPLNTLSQKYSELTEAILITNIKRFFGKKHVRQFYSEFCDAMALNTSKFKKLTTLEFEDDNSMVESGKLSLSQGSLDENSGISANEEAPAPSDLPTLKAVGSKREDMKVVLRKLSHDQKELIKQTVTVLKNPSSGADSIESSIRSIIRLSRSCGHDFVVFIPSKLRGKYSEILNATD